MNFPKVTSGGLRPVQLQWLSLCGLLALLLAGCKPAPGPAQGSGTEPPPAPADTHEEFLQGVIRLQPWPTLLIMEHGEGGPEDVVAVPYALISPEWQALPTADLRPHAGNLVELRGQLLVNGPARVIRLRPDAVQELEGGLGTPGRAAETEAAASRLALVGRVFTLPFLARNGRKLPEPGDATAIEAQVRELEAGLPVVVLVRPDDPVMQLDQAHSPLWFLADATGAPLPVETLRPLLNQPVSVSGEGRAQGAWQVLHADAATLQPQPAPAQPAPQP